MLSAVSLLGGAATVSPYGGRAKGTHMVGQSNPSRGPLTLEVDAVEDLSGALAGAGLGAGHAVLVVVGGAGGMSGSDLDAFHTLAVHHVLPVLSAASGAVVDGGTDAGVMAALGRARRDLGSTVPLVGVAARGTVRVGDGPSGGDDDRAAVEPNHTHLVLVPGQEWGEESPWLSRVATALAGDAPSLTLVVNGGEITYDDIGHSLGAGRPVLVLAGTGRTADAIASAGQIATGDAPATGERIPTDGTIRAGGTTGSPPDPRAREAARSELVRVVPFAAPEEVARALEQVLGRIVDGRGESPPAGG